MPSQVDDVLEQAWRNAEARPLSPDARVIAEPLPTVVAAGRVMAGVDRDGARYLLVPIDIDDDVVGDGSGRWITFERIELMVEEARSAFAALRCTRRDLFDEFRILAADILDEVGRSSGPPGEAVRSVLSDWRELLQALGRQVLTRERMIGLFAELLLLEDLAALNQDAALESWRGPLGARHDFQRGAVSVEVKATTARRGRPVIVHGLDQLDDPPEGALYLRWSRLEPAIDRGVTLSALIDRLRAYFGEDALFNQRLSAAGYVIPDGSAPEPALVVLETRLYRVDNTFPRLTRSHFVSGDPPRGIRAINYELDLSGDDPVPVTATAERELFRRLASVATRLDEG
jgi:hypothetical protein